jgi:hypothetical protein
LWGAAWLHKATKNPMYLNYIKVNGQILGADVSDNTFGWDNKHVGARILLSKVHNHNLFFFKNACTLKMLSFDTHIHIGVFYFRNFLFRR